MSKNPVAVTTGEDVSQLVERIQQAKIARIESAPAVDLRLTKWDAYEYLSRSCLLKHEVVALLHGMIPHPTETADDYSWMEPDDSVVLRRFLADEKAGRRAYPMLVEEFIEYVMPWRHELPDELAFALDSRSKSGVDACISAATNVSTKTDRKNSSASALAEVNRAMESAISVLEAVGLECRPTLPGSKAHYCDYVRLHSRRLSALAVATLHDIFKQCGYRWKQGGGSRKEIDKRVRCALDVRAKETCPPSASVVVSDASYDPWQLFNTKVKT